MVADQMRQQRQQPGPPRAAPCRRRAPETGVKNIEGRIHNKTFKIKKLIDVHKKVEVKKNGQVIRKITVCRKAIFPGAQ